MFDWDEANIRHIAEHGVSADEAEEALGDPKRIPEPAYLESRERRRAVLGMTANGRLLFVVFTERDRLIRVITARDASVRERRRHRRRSR